MTLDSKGIHDIGQPCLEANAPYCVAACPLHVKAKDMVTAVSNGNFAEGLKVFQSTAVFAGIMAYICDHPCENKCKRRELDDSINISLIEKACADYAYDTLIKADYKITKKQKIAVVGSGLSSLTVAMLLAKKGYSITIFEADQKPGGKLNDYPEEVLPKKVLLAELSLIKQPAIEIKYGVTVGQDITLESLLESFDLVYLGAGADSNLKAGNYNPATLVTDNPRIIVGGGMLGQEVASSPALTFASAQTAALSIERTIQKVSVSANRKNENAYDSKLYTNLEWYKKQGEILPANKHSYSKEEAVAEATRCLKCRCVECMRGCDYLSHYDQYPGDCIKSVVKNVIIMQGWGVRIANDFINSCNLCGLCKEMCPVDIDMGFVNREARRLMWEEENMPATLHDYPLRDMEFALSEQAAVFKHQPGFTSSRYLFFPGCQMAGSMPQTLTKTYRLLTEQLAGGVGLLISCCGAPADWAGRQEVTAEIWQDIREKWLQTNKPQIIVACPGCHKILKEALPEADLKFITETLLELDLPKASAMPAEFAFHDPCTTRYEKEIQDSARQLAINTGAGLHELEFNHNRAKCCGYGGLQYHINPDLTGEIIKKRIAQSPLPYLTSCSNCRDFFLKYDKDSYHVLELIFGKERAISGELYSLTDFSERRDNRRELKRRLLQELWQEDASMTVPDYKSIKLIINDEIREKMHDQHILIDDLQEVIYFAEKNNRKMLSPETGYFVTGKRLKIITYWVEYVTEGDSYVIKNCYSHRMQVLTDTI